MTHYILRRLLHMIPTLILISMVSFVVIQAPPGDMLTSRLAELAEQVKRLFLVRSHHLAESDYV